MIVRLSLSALLLTAAAPAVAQDAAAPAQPQAAETSPLDAAIQQTAQAFGQCISAGFQGLGEAVAPEAGAASILGGCATQRQQLEQAVEAMIATLPAEQQPEAREQLRASMAGTETEIASAIRDRQAEAASPAPAPQPE